MASVVQGPVVSVSEERERIVQEFINRKKQAEANKVPLMLQSSPQIPPISGLTKKRQYSEIGDIGSHI